MPNSRLRHDGYGDCILDLSDQTRIAHPRHLALGPYVSWDPLKCHYSCNLSLTSLLPLRNEALSDDTRYEPLASGENICAAC
ncbi:hypothetical protein FCM35_KLT20982 [Carex littledalei]|uniref:Uncharacterized protein n=1 Tax=Carex littledalei TaxID=544730 RepID=A0A833VTC9_9POAL|nr:hypothetical protein FCM35_KLT20982 [Carex littledalei]